MRRADRRPAPANAGAGERIAAIRADLLAEHLGVEAGEEVEAKLDGDRLADRDDRGAARQAAAPSFRFEPDEPNAVETAIADSEALDPESSGEEFEPLARPGLFAGFRAAVRRGRR